MCGAQEADLGIGSVASLYQQPFGMSRSPAIINFLIFASVWSLLVLAYIGLTPIYLAGFFHRLAVLGLLVVTSIFWFAGSVALASFMGGPWNCGGNTWCGSIEAIIAFGFVTWYGFNVSLFSVSMVWKVFSY